jgi:hypothetical protein
VKAKGYKNLRLQGESIAEIDYRPHKCKKSHRLIIVRKNISVQKGENALFEEIRYLFYITNRRSDTPEKIVGLANGRCATRKTSSNNSKTGSTPCGCPSMIC